MQEILGLTSLQLCLQLPRDESAACCCIMSVFGYDETRAFRGLWVIPPGVNHRLWFSIYGHTPNLMTGKGNSTQEQLAHRVAHYLGFTIPPTPRASVPPVVNVMTVEEKKAMIARLQAEVDGEGGNNAAQVDGMEGNDGGNNAAHVGGTEGSDGNSSAP
jgi:hypothetical protein